MFQPTNQFFVAIYNSKPLIYIVFFCLKILLSTEDVKQKRSTHHGPSACPLVTLLRCPTPQAILAGPRTRSAGA